MKKLVITLCVAALATVGFAGSAKADDFKGFYVGGNLGGAFEKGKVKTSTVFSNTGYFAQTSVDSINSLGNQSLDPKGFTGGGQVGYNFQTGAIVFGAEFDFGGLKLDQTRTFGAVYPCCSPSAYSATQRVQSDWMLSVRPRVGVTFGRALVYGTAGLATTNVKYTEAFSDTFDSASESGQFKKNLNGWTVGGGAELLLSHHLSVKGEYLYADFGKASTTSTNLTTSEEGPFPDSVFTHSAEVKAHIVRAGINIRF